VQDQILTNLGRVSDLKVISHTTVRQYKSGVPRNLREIGKQLGVSHILEGSVQRAGTIYSIFSISIRHPNASFLRRRQ
jgi:TolB-like protein